MLTITWEDVSDFRIRDANGQVKDFDAVTAGVQSIGSGEPLLLDMNPHFDGAIGPLTSGHITQAAVDTLNAAAGTTLQFDGTGQLTDGTPGGVGLGALIAHGWVNPATMAITASDPAIHAAVGEILLESVGDHYIAGDGRANENFGLTTIHHVFHEDHNVQLVNLKSTILGGMFDANADKAKGFDWMVKVGSASRCTASARPAQRSIAANVAGYTGATYDFSNLHTISGVGSYVADLTNIRDARGNVIRGWKRQTERLHLASTASTPTLPATCPGTRT